MNERNELPDLARLMIWWGKKIDVKNYYYIIDILYYVFYNFVTNNLTITI